MAKGVPTEVLFLGEETGAEVAAEHGRADLVVANNVFAHVPDIVDFAKGLRALVADDGRVTIEIPHLLRLIEGREYDTIYHEHYSYLSLLTTQRVLAAAGLTVVDVEELPTHGGSLRTWSAPAETAPATRRPRWPRCSPPRRRPACDTLEGHAGLRRGASPRCATTCSSSWSRGRGRARSWPATGRRARATRCSTTAASARTCWRSRSTATRSSTGSSCPARTSRSTTSTTLAEAQPDYVLILPWNLRAEIAAQLAYVREWGGRLGRARCPTLEVLP